MLETVPNPHPGTLYLVRFTCPEFTALCPITGQPDFAHFVIDYVPEAAILESKSLKLYLGAFRNHGAFHEDCTLTIAAGSLRPSLRAGCGSAATGIRAAASRSTSSTRRPSRRPGCGSPTPVSLPIAGAAERPMADPIREAIRDRALSVGFDAVGFAEARLGPEARDGLGEFIARGYHGDMGWLAGTAARRGDPHALWPEARSVVVLGVNYAPEDDPLALAEERDRGVVSVYARGRDYHDTLKRRLKALAQLDRRTLAGGAEALCRHRSGDGKAARRARRAGLARQAHQSGVARLRLLAVPRRNLSEPRTRTRRRGGRPLRVLPALPRRLPDGGVSRRPTGSMPGAASPI